jgi:nucleotide-binding universal stress UspA family protein
MKIEHILAGIDFEKQTGHILAYASVFAEKFRASLHLFHVIDYVVTPPAYLDQYIEEEKKAAEGKFEAIKKELSSVGIGVDAKVIVGRLQASFETAIKKTGADLLMLGFISHALRRSSSEKLIKGLQMPMLVVRGKKSEVASAGNISVRKILCPVDFSDTSKKALQVAREVANAFSSDIEVMHVLPESVIRKIRTFANRDKALQDVYEQEKNRFEDFLSASSFEKTVILDQGEPHKRIVELAQEKDIDLIVIGARGIGLIKGMLIGSVTDAVLKSSPCPVFVIH